ncbi:MAG TPA: PEP-CTERM sorting domain-containing protein [Pirellulales bacterium]
MNTKRQDLRIVFIPRFLIMLIVLSCAAVLHAEDHEWIGDQDHILGPNYWTFNDGTMWSGFAIPGAAPNNTDADITNDDAIFGGHFPHSPPLQLGAGGTIYFGDFDGIINSDPGSQLFYPAQNVINHSLDVQSGDWTFDFGPAHYFGSQSVVDSGSYRVTDVMRVGDNVLHTGDAGTASLTLSGPGGLYSNSGAIGRGNGVHGTFTVSGAETHWDNTTDFTVGHDGGIGSAFITNGGTINSVSTTIGLVGGHGEMSVSGSGSSLNLSGALNVGSLGTYGGASGSFGELSVQSGGVVHSGDHSRIGENDGSVGIVNVTGPNSQWLNSSSLAIGSGGDGTLNVTSGGAVSNLTTSLGASVGIGKVTVDGAGSQWNITGEFGISRGSLTISDQGLVNQTGGGAFVGETLDGGTVDVNSHGVWDLTSSGMIILGHSGKGTLDISSGGHVNSGLANIGNQATAQGTVSVSGGTWTNSSSVTIGDFGKGVLTVDNGGLIATGGGVIGSAAGGVGQVSVTGVGSLLKSDSSTSASFFIGDHGQGTLAVSAGAAFTIDHGSAYVANAPGGSGAATVMGSGSTWSDSGDLVVASGDATSQGSVHISDAGQLSVTASMLIGNLGHGTLDVGGGGSASSANGLIGVQSGAVGLASIHGTGSQWNIASGLTVGAQGDGTLSISSGATVAVQNANGATVGSDNGSTGAVTISGDGSSLTMGDLSVGRFGEGSVTIQQGASASNARADIGSEAGGSGSVVVTGQGSHWTSTNEVNIGGQSQGSLQILDGATVEGTYFSAMGRATDGIGTATVSGDGSKWTTSIVVGDAGHGALNIQNGGLVETRGGAVGVSSGGFGQVTVSGAGTALRSDSPGADDFNIGGQGHATFTVSDGAAFSVSHGNTFVARDDGSVADATVTGAGSSWTSGGLYIASNDHASQGSLLVTNSATLNVDSTIFVGEWGKGSFEVAAGGEAMTVDGRIGINPSAVGSVSVHGAGSLWTVTNNLNVGEQGVGTLSLSDHGEVHVGNQLSLGTQGTIDFGHDLGGRINVGDGFLGSTPHGTIRVGPNGTLAGSGSTNGRIFVDGGTVSPGFSPGVLHIGGDALFSATSSLDLQIGGLNPGSQYDQLVVGGDLTLPDVVNISFIDGFAPRTGDQFHLLVVGGALNGPVLFDTGDVPFTADFSDGVYTLTAVPEPSSFALAGLGVVVLVAGSRARSSKYRNSIRCSGESS